MKKNEVYEGKQARYNHGGTSHAGGCIAHTDGIWKSYSNFPADTLVCASETRKSVGKEW